MATYTVAPTELGVYDKTLAANVVDVVTFTGQEAKANVLTVRIVGDGTSSLSITADGTVPTVASQAAHFMPAGAIYALDLIVPVGQNAIKLISAGTPKYSVTRDI